MSQPAGWYPVEGGQRYWNGSDWVTDVMDAPSTNVARSGPAAHGSPMNLVALALAVGSLVFMFNTIVMLASIGMAIAATAFVLSLTGALTRMPYTWAAWTGAGISAIAFVIGLLSGQ